ncbi:DUF664 domain-containing protein [Amycolatopsis taiwanensis]|uniref:DUF664 domain-containing protein n=1 Tax=Amycolatopsis taiwanensis TaxID=342230 RepID=A0A9W6RB28_9PSEU|nr:hypothetical protein Atai01_74510 [Amycolatopsis taiwanensis]
MVHLTEPPRTLSGSAELLTGYLDFYRDTIPRKLAGLSEAELRRTRVPSGWVPLGLLKHLGYVELRWLRWGFAVEQVDDPWADWNADRTEWRLDPADDLASVTAFFDEQCARSRAIVEGAQLSAVAADAGLEPVPSAAGIRPACGPSRRRARTGRRRDLRMTSQ